jgi:acetolactate synthase small subunit
MKETYLFTILSEHKKELVSIIVSMLNRKLIQIEGITTAKTDIHSQVTITIEVIIEPADVRFILLRIKNIVEVLQAEACLINDTWYQKVAIYTLKKEGYNSEVFEKLQKYGGILAGYYKGEIIIQKIGRDEDIQLLYNELDGPQLLSFTKSAAISLQPLLEEQSSVISMAA